MSREPGDTLKGTTLVGAKRGEAEASVVQAASSAEKRRRTWLLPPMAATVLGQSGAAYHKLVEFDKRVDLTIKHHRQTIEARLRAAGVGPNGEAVSSTPPVRCSPQPVTCLRACEASHPSCRSRRLIRLCES